MTYNNYFPANYQPYQQPYQQYSQPNYQQYQQPQQTAQPQIQNGGFVQVHNEMEARNYPIAPGNSVTFKDENAPYMYTKTMGFSQLDRPIFERYRLVKEEAPELTQNAPVSGSNTQPINDIPYALKSDLEAMGGIISTLKEELDALKADFDSISAKKQRPKKEDKEEAE